LIRLILHDKSYNSKACQHSVPEVSRDNAHGRWGHIAITETLSDLNAEIAALEGKLSKARQVKQGMMSELLTGRIRLVES
jgi:hypothetical protein